ncbi:MAG: iclR helix-turn-helix domain protein [Hyphomicrobiales bacterium]|nr:iclR helix-turn-helix domain protein [Hyphomicrobiales bacterium]
MNEQADAARVWFRLLRLQSRINLAITAIVRELGLSVPQCDVLTTLTEREGVSQQELAERLYVTKGNISGLIDRLEAASLVERRSIAGDKRSHAIFLTATGRKLAEQGINVQRDFVAQTLGRLPPDQLAALDRLLVTTRDLVREQTGGARRVRRSAAG